MRGCLWAGAQFFALQTYRRIKWLAARDEREADLFVNPASDIQDAQSESN